jgi:hypothetical protein
MYDLGPLPTLESGFASIEMTKHIASFKDNEIDGQCLLEADDESLVALGVSLSMQRKKLLRLIGELISQG